MIVKVFEWKSKDAMNSAHEHAEVLKMKVDYDACCDYVLVKLRGKHG